MGRLSLEYPSVSGLAVIAIAVSGLAAGYLRAARRQGLGVAGWAGISVLGASVALLASPLEMPAGLVPLAWTGYVVAVDSAVHSIRGRSMLRCRADSFAWLAVLSVFLWLPFEWYNLRLAGWYRAGLPVGLLRYVLLGWSFACIWPALFVTADFLLAATGAGADRARSPGTLPIRTAWLSAAAGAACLATPLLVPRLDLGEHLLGLASVGFLLLVEPWNAAGGRPSLWQDWRQGLRARPRALAASGLVCGLLADGLNAMAGNGWHCIWSWGATWKLFELPLAAYALLPLFGAQAFSMHVFATGLLGLPTAPVPSSEAGSCRE